MIAWAEDELAGIMVELRFVDPHDFAPRGCINYVSIPGGNLPFRDHALMVERIRIRDGEIRGTVHRLAAIRVKLAKPGTIWIGEAGVECESEQSTLVVARHQADDTAGDIQKRLGQDLAVFQNQNLAGLRDDEHSPRSVVS